MQWQRAAVGVIRVEAECARYALNHSSYPVRFCTINTDHDFELISTRRVNEALQRIGMGEGSKKSLEPAPTKIDPAASTATPEGIENVTAPSLVRRVLHQLIRGMIWCLPAFLAHAIWRWRAEIGHLVKQNLHLANRDAQTTNQQAYLNSSDRMQAKISQWPLTRNDVYVSVGADWGRENLDAVRLAKECIGFRVLLCSYDLIPILLPHLCLDWVAKGFPKYYQNLARTADHVVCISHSTQRDFIAFLEREQLPSINTSIMPLGCTIDTQTLLQGAGCDPEFEACQALLTEPFILFVSTIERRKNHETLYKAYVQLLTQLPPDDAKKLPKLVFVGMPGWGVDDLVSDLRTDPRIVGKIVILNHLGDRALAWVYQHALFTVYPSLYEGWGLPIAESLAYGKFCLAANNSSLPEVGQDFVEYVDAWDVQAWSARLWYYIQHPAKLAEKELYIRTHYQPSTWSRGCQILFEKATQLLR